MYDLVEGYDHQRRLKEYIAKCFTFIVINTPLVSPSCNTRLVRLSCNKCSIGNTVM